MSEINPNNEFDDFRTPRNLFLSFDDKYNFDLDVAASDENALCPNYFTEEQDGLKQKWYGTVWCNPPYSDVEPWLSKGLAELEVKNCDYVAFLLNVDTSTRWFQELVLPFVSEIHLVRGRLNFSGPHAPENMVNPKPSMVAVFDQSVGDNRNTIRLLNCIDKGGTSTGMQSRLPNLF